jgi:hypothetical protein
VSGRHLRRIASVVFVVLLLVNAAWIPKGAHRFSEAKNTWAACYLRSGNIELCDAVSGSPVHPDAAATHLREKLEFLKRNRLSLFSSR